MKKFQRNYGLKFTNCVWLVEAGIYYTTNELLNKYASYLYMACHLSATDDGIRKLYSNLNIFT